MNANNVPGLNTVEAYDGLFNSWSPMSSMIERRCGHNLVAIKNKLFVMVCISGDGYKPCEVLD